MSAVAVGRPTPALSSVHHGFYWLIPFTFALAVLRYRLFEIEVIINRTLVYGTLTVLLAGLYLLLVRLFTLIIRSCCAARMTRQ